MLIPAVLSCLTRVMICTELLSYANVKVIKLSVLLMGTKLLASRVGFGGATALSEAMTMCHWKYGEVDETIHECFLRDHVLTQQAWQLDASGRVTSRVHEAVNPPRDLEHHVPNVPKSTVTGLDAATLAFRHEARQPCVLRRACNCVSPVHRSGSQPDGLDCLRSVLRPTKPCAEQLR